MCGITGAIWTDPQRELSDDALRRMTEVLRHRGPDDDGFYRSELHRRQPHGVVPGVALGFRRLAIIDVQGGRQPIANEDQSVWMVYNGEIYNEPALRRRLEGAGHKFRTRCDSETIVHLYEDEGLDCFKHLNGMFALALWDENRARLVLARDRLGQKPLVYREEPGRLLFASELKSLLEAPDVPREIDHNALDEYLTYQYVPHPRTIFQGISKLPPGHLAVAQSGRLDVRPYWTVDFRRQRSDPAQVEAERLGELLSSSVEMRMRSDVPLGAFLSGGVDSSLIVALMQRASSERIKTFTISFPIREYDESHYARRVAEHLGTEHREFAVTPNMMEILPRLVWSYDEPFADSSAVPTWYVSQHTRQHVTVALSGDGGDELFAGYPRYRAAWMAGGVDAAPLLRSLLASRLWQRLPSSPRQKSLVRRAQRFGEALRLSPPRRYLDWISIFNEPRRAALYSDSFLESLPSHDPARFLIEAWARSGRRGAVTAASMADLVTYLPCDLNCKVDIASMAHSLEVRQPFLDYRLVEWAAQLPSRLNFRRGAGKRLLRAAFGHLLPREIWTRRKMGFGVPLDHWFRHELKDLLRDTLLDDTAQQRGLFRPEAVQQLVDEHLEGTFDHSYRLWALLILELWLREWL